MDLAGLRASTASPYVNNSHTPACLVAHPLHHLHPAPQLGSGEQFRHHPPISGDGEMLTYMIEPVENLSSYLTDPNHTQGVEQWTIDWAATTPSPTFVNSWDLPSTQANGDQLGCFNPLNYYGTVCIPQPSTSTTGIHIDSVADRMQQFFHYTSNGGQGSIWTSAHAIQIIPNATTLLRPKPTSVSCNATPRTPTRFTLPETIPSLIPSILTLMFFCPAWCATKSATFRASSGFQAREAMNIPGSIV